MMIKIYSHNSKYAHYARIRHPALYAYIMQMIIIMNYDYVAWSKKRNKKKKKKKRGKIPSVCALCSRAVYIFQL